jgi:hypothetical protein
MSDDTQYVQGDDGSRTFTISVPAETLQSDEFLNNMKSGEDLMKSWTNQKSMIGKNSIPDEKSTDEVWNKFYEKTRPTSGYGTGDESIDKLLYDNGLTAKQGLGISSFIKEMKTIPESETNGTQIKSWIESIGADKAGAVDAVINETLSKEEQDIFKKDSEKVAVLKIAQKIVEKFGVKPADFQVGKGGTPATLNKSDREGYNREKSDIIKSGRMFTDLDDRVLRQKYGVTYINIAALDKE